MKRFIFSLLIALFAVVGLVSCGKEEKKETPITPLDTPALTVEGNVVKWQAVNNAKGYVVKVNDQEKPEQTELSYTVSNETPGTFNVSVKAVSSDTTKFQDSAYSTVKTITIEENLENTTVWIVGDSTVCDYAKSRDEQGNVTAITDTSYFYDRYGYGTQIGNYLDSEKVTIKNIALSGRSSKSFILEDNYTTLKNGIKSGDYLIIGFGHNDEKSDDADRFASALEPTTTEGSFKYNLYNYYCKIASDKGATPIICTPIVRASSSNDYTGSNGHITADGNYAQAIIDLGVEKSITTIDLTTLTKNLYTKLGYDEAITMHALRGGLNQTTPDWASVDATHINIYGAKMVAYMFANALKNTNNSLAKYVNKTITEPTKANDLVQNQYYKYLAYTPVDLTDYADIIDNGYKYLDSNTNEVVSKDLTTNFNYTSDGWYGTAFGDLGGDPTNLTNSSYFAMETSEGVYKVGQSKSAATYYKGKISSTSEGFAFMFKKINMSDNFTVSAKGKIIAQNSDGKQSGFGMMLRDDCYTLFTDPDNNSIDKNTLNNSGIIGNSVSAGVWLGGSVGSSVYVNYSRESGAIMKNDTSSHLPVVGDEFECSIERVGQTVTTKVIYNGETFTKTYTDFDFSAHDSEYMYVGLFAARGIICEWSNLVYTYTGVSQGA